MIKYEKLVLGELETNCYLVWDDVSHEGVVIDPADAGVEISDEIQRLSINPLMVLATHGHFDHMLAAMDLKMIYNIPLGVSEKDLFLLKRQKKTAERFLHHPINTLDILKVDINLDKVVNIVLGDFKIKVIKTPGHTPGGVCFYDKTEKILFCGDTVFAEGMVGSTEHQYSSMIDLKKSLRVIMELPSETTILPGHGEEDTISNLRELLGS